MGQAKQKEHKSHPDTPDPSCPTSHLQQQAVYKGPGLEQGEDSEPFPGHDFPVSGIQCPGFIRTKLPSQTNAHELLFCMISI